MKISQRFHNDTYAPGIATYGKDGKPGEQGQPGASMFFTDYSLPDDFISFANMITSRKLPIKTEDTILDRMYVNGDTFVTPVGQVFQLTDINNLCISSANGIALRIHDYMKLIGKFSETALPFDNNTKDALKKGSLTITDCLAQDTDTSSLLTLIKDNTQSSDLNFINMQALFGDSPDVDFSIKYDNGYNAFVLSSQYPIILDANVYVNNNNDGYNQISEYSPIYTADNPVTEFVGTCRTLQYKTDASIYTYTKKDSSTLFYGCVYGITLIDAAKTETDGMYFETERYYDSGIMIHYQNGIYQDFQNYKNGEHTYYFKQDYDYVKLNDIISKIKNYELNNIQVSLLYNIECYLKCKEKAIVGLTED